MGEALCVDTTLAQSEIVPSTPEPDSPPSLRHGLAEQFNTVFSLDDILQRHGYRPFGQDRWLFPGSKTGDQAYDC